MSNQQAPVDNSPLSEQELQHFRRKLLHEQEAAQSKIRELKESLESLNKNADDNQSAQDHHHGDLATDESRRSTLLSALEVQNEKLDQITVALDRIETGNYGICVDTGRPIQKGRLEAKPYATRSVGAQK